MTPSKPAEVKRTKLTERQQKTIARIINRHTSWTINWWISDEDTVAMYAETARAVARYIERLKP